MRIQFIIALVFLCVCVLVVNQNEAVLDETMDNDMDTMPSDSLPPGMWRRRLFGGPGKRKTKAQLRAIKETLRVEVAMYKREKLMRSLPHGTKPWPPPWRSTWDERRQAIHEYYVTNGAKLVTDHILEQLRKHIRQLENPEVIHRMHTTAWNNFYRGILTADISDCAAVTPECGWFLIAALHRPPAQNMTMLHRKCCVSHKRLKNVTVATLQLVFGTNVDVHNLSTPYSARDVDFEIVVESGLLLAMVRSGVPSMSPWESDADLCIRSEDKPLVEQRLMNSTHEAMVRAGFPDDDWGHSLRRPLARRVGWDDPSIRHIVEAERVRVIDVTSRVEIYTTKYHQKNALRLYPTVLVPFYDVNVLVPVQALEWLDQHKVWKGTGWHEPRMRDDALM
jgi:hypothetical protein